MCVCVCLESVCVCVCVDAQIDQVNCLSLFPKKSKNSHAYNK